LADPSAPPLGGGGSTGSIGSTGAPPLTPTSAHHMMINDEITQSPIDGPSPSSSSNLYNARSPTTPVETGSPSIKSKSYSINQQPCKQNNQVGIRMALLLLLLLLTHIHVSIPGKGLSIA
jgi:hypothetical protein